MYECRYDERLKTKGIYTSRMHWVVWGTGTPKDRDEVNRRDVCECDGWVCVLEVIDVPSILSVIRKPATWWGYCRLLCSGWPRTSHGGSGITRKNRDSKNTCCLLLIDKSRTKDKTYIWLSVWWKTITERWWIYIIGLAYTGFLEELEYLKIETRLIDEKFASVRGECVI